MFFLQNLSDLSKKGNLILPEKLDGITSEIPPTKFNSDISTNVAMVLSKLNKKSPIDLANTLVEEIKKNNGNCIFLKDNKCTVYKSRPIQCRTWPFWPENMNTKTWNNDIAKNCPGVGKGKVKTKKEILKQVQIDYENELNIRNKN